MRAMLEWREAAHCFNAHECPLIRPPGTFSREGRRETGGRGTISPHPVAPTPENTPP